MNINVDINIVSCQGAKSTSSRSILTLKKGYKNTEIHRGEKMDFTVCSNLIKFLQREVEVL